MRISLKRHWVCSRRKDRRLNSNRNARTVVQSLLRQRPHVSTAAARLIGFVFRVPNEMPYDA